MIGVTIQSPNKRVVEHVLIELGFMPLYDGAQDDWVCVSTGEVAAITRTDGVTAPGAEEWQRIYEVIWFPRGWRSV